MLEGLDLPSSVWFFWIVYIPSLIWAFWKGAAPERWGAAILCAIPLVQLGMYTFARAEYDQVDPVSIVADLVGVFGFGLLALNARRAWPLWACAFQLLAFTAHFSRLLEISGHPLIYAWMKSSPTLLAALTVLIGTMSHRRRVYRNQEVGSWMDWSEVRARESESRI